MHECVSAPHVTLFTAQYTKAGAQFELYLLLHTRAGGPFPDGTA